MKLGFPFFSVVLTLGSIAATPFISSSARGVFAQGGNSISGYVSGVNRVPVQDLNVELNDELYRTIARTRTNGSGYYSFSGVSAGRFVIRVLTFGTDYAEQEITVEIQNTVSSTGRIGGFSQQTYDISLRLRKGVTLTNAAPLFAQSVPDDARKLYEKALSDLDNKHEKEGLAGLKSAIEIFPKYYYALERLGTEYIKLGRPETFQAAEYLFMLAVDVNPRGGKSWYGLAYARYSLGKTKVALEAAEKAVEINALWPEAVCLSGILLRRSKNYAEAEKRLLRAQELSNDAIPQVHWELALLYGNDLNRYADAARELRLFLKGRPDAKDADRIAKLIADFELKAKAN